MEPMGGSADDSDEHSAASRVTRAGAPRLGHRTLARDAKTSNIGPAAAGGRHEERRIAERMSQRLFGPAPAPMRIGRFTVLEEVGRGGMGVVYAAYDERLDRKVAVKVLLECADPDARRRFLQEARALARLSHPNVVTGHEVGESDGDVFLAMEFIHGQSLATWLRTRPDWPPSCPPATTYSLLRCA